MIFSYCQIIITLLFAILVFIEGGYVKTAYKTLKDVKKLLEKCEKHNDQSL